MWRDQERVVNGHPVRLVADSTIWYRLRKVRTFLLHYGRDILPRKEFPGFDETVPDTYSAEQLKSFFAACGPDERLWYSLLFGLGLRRGELAHLRWENVDLQNGLITIQSSSSWKTKTRKSWRVPIPADLLAALRTRRQGHPDYIYVIGDGAKPLTELLKPLKRIAFQAGMNCGHCMTKSGKSCSDGPYCHKFTVQKLRRSYATHLHEGGASINTLRVLLGHSSPAPILRYLAPQDIQSPELLADLTSSISALTSAGYGPAQSGEDRV
jgi:integrase